MQLIARSPEAGIYKAVDYLHAVEVVDARRLLFTAGTMGLDERGAAPPDLDEQLRLIWTNLRRILAEAGMTTDNIVRLTSYLRDPSYAAANRDARLAALGGRLVPTTAIVAQTLETDWLVEIEVLAAA